MTSSFLNTPLPLSNPNPSALSKKTSSTTAQAWSEHETSHLIASYQDKWYSLGRGPLKSHQWEDVAASLASRCGYGSRTITQCRHKMEKLRKRYRAERKQPGRSFWVHFDQMDRMEQGPQLNSVRPSPSLPTRSHAKLEVFDDDESEDEDEDDDQEESDDGEEETARVDKCGWREQQDRNESARKLASVVNRFGEGLLRIEKRRMEMMRELERDWMEMEAKRENMWMESQKYVIDAISRSFHPKKKSRKLTDMRR